MRTNKRQNEVDMTNRETYDAIFSEMFGVQISALNADFTFAAVAAWDSVAHLALITKLEDSFDILIDTEDILTYGGYENGMKILAKYGVSFEE